MPINGEVIERGINGEVIEREKVYDSIMYL